MIDRQTIPLRPATADDAERIAGLFTDEGYPAGPSDIRERLEAFTTAYFGPGFTSRLRTSYSA